VGRCTTFGLAVFAVHFNAQHSPTSSQYSSLTWISLFLDEIPETSSRAIELSDKRQIRKSPKTLILGACNLSSFRVICISSVRCDLRFYDYSTVGKCNLRLYIRNFPSPIVAIHFYCPNDSGKNSKLIFGDMVGSVRVIDLLENFKFRNGSLIRQFSYQELMKVATLIDVRRT
jgi:hypothetical protein